MSGKAGSTRSDMKYRLKYVTELKSLKLNLLKLCSTVSNQIQKAVNSLLQYDIELAKQVAEEDDIIDQMEHEIEKQCMNILLKEQPVAKDFREVFATLKMITDLERIGDQAEDIARLVMSLSGKNVVKKFNYISEMTEVTLEMVTGSVNAFIKDDLLIAEQVVKKDDILDELFIKVRGELSEKIKKNEDHADDIINIIMVAKYLERIGDHAVNLCEWTKYYEVGQRTY